MDYPWVASIAMSLLDAQEPDVQWGCEHDAAR
ncbi:hypothetical protein N802_17535 [Knoellia sinensis KCTC 19936]|uniref:Uncharacterized protein n=1 Tax=Knoellia sinensis KCTC 19936 TaxID=1385520 RepID=A0A0A0J7C8_9MICO|nr:hypothetical protein N802_17535 [Knoellia sinensis KCTC 19936]